MGPTIAAAARGELRVAAKAMRFAPPADAQVGDVLLALVWTHAGELLDTAHVPAGWTAPIGVSTTTNYKLWVYAHAVAASDFGPVDFPLQAAGSVAHEWQGSLLVVRGASLGCIEQVAGQEFAATATPPSTGVTDVEQATSLLVSLTVVLGTATPSGNLGDNTNEIPYTSDFVDSFSSRLIEEMHSSLVSRRAGETGGLTFFAGSATAAASGVQFTLVVREGRPHTPLELYDVVPGNLGLMGTDRRTEGSAFGAAASSGTGGGLVGGLVGGGP